MVLSRRVFWPLLSILIVLLLIIPILAMGQGAVKKDGFILPAHTYHVETIETHGKARVQYSVDVTSSGQIDVVLFNSKGYGVFASGASAPFLPEGTKLQTWGYSANIVLADQTSYHLVIMNRGDQSVTLDYHVAVHGGGDLTWWALASIVLISTFILSTIGVKQAVNKNKNKKRPMKFYLHEEGIEDESNVGSLLKYPYNIANFSSLKKSYQCVEYFFGVVVLILAVYRPYLDLAVYAVVVAIVVVCLFVYLYILSEFEPESMYEYHSPLFKRLYLTYNYAPLVQCLGILFLAAGSFEIGIVLYLAVSGLWLLIYDANRKYHLEPLKTYSNTMDLTNDALEREKQLEIARNLELIEDGLTLVGIEQESTSSQETLAADTWSWS